MEKRAGRMEWLDAAKGIGIVLVVIGHAWKSVAVRDPIYAFHMPLFFIAAGYVAKPAPVREFAVKQWRALGLPYIAFLVCLMAADPLIEGARGFRPMFRDWGSAVQAGLMGGTSLHGPLTVFWFVPCLMIARLAQVAIYKLWPDARDWRWALSMAVVLALVVWWGRASNFSPLGIIAAPVALVYLWLGALWRTWGQDRWLLLACAVASVTALLIYGPLAPLNMKYGDYGPRPYVTLPLAFILSLGLGWLMRLIPWRPFVALGRMSLVIMFLHVPVIHYLRPYFDVWGLSALALILPVAAYYLLARFKMGRRLFLGAA
ncbi:MAG: acyltransferase family protein [Sphingomonadaceae bacterium]|nr:acyltransferase family protein [Sphingomonadaceae bacterium]